MEFHRRAVEKFDHNKRAGGLGALSNVANPAVVATSSSVASIIDSSTTSSEIVPTTTTTTTTTTAAVATTTTTTPPAVVTTTTTTTSSSVAPVVTTTTSVAPVTTTTTTSSIAPVIVTTTTSSSVLLHTTSTGALTTSSTTAEGLTTTAIITISSSTTSSSSHTSTGTSLSSTSGSSSGPSTGTVIGIVAGALAGIVILATIIGYLFRKKWGRKDEDDSPFDRDEFRRGSMMLDDDAYGGGGGMPGGHSPQMSEYSLNNMSGQAGLGRANTVLPGVQRNGTLSSPRPPSSIVNHFQRQQQPMVPSFQPGQVVNMAQYGAPQAHFAGGAYGGQPGGLELYGGYPVGAPQQHMLDRGMYGGQASPPHLQQHQSYGQQPQHPYATAGQQNYNAGGLERNASNGSNYSQDGRPFAGQRSRTPSPIPYINNQNLNNNERLSLVQEELDRSTYSRSGTPTNSNVQQSYFSHGRNDSEIGAGAPSLPGYVVQENQMGRTRSLTARTYGEEKDSRLSVRNAERPSSGISDIYGGYEQ